MLDQPLPTVPSAAPPAELVIATRPRRPIAGGIAFALVIAGYLALAGAAAWGYVQTQDAFIPAPPWWVVTSSIAAVPVGIAAGLGLLLGIVGAARREKPGWPAVAAMIFSLPALGYVGVALFVFFTVTASCAGSAGACG